MIQFRVYGKAEPKGSVRSVFRKAKNPGEHGRMLRFDSNRKSKGWEHAVRDAFAAHTGWEEGAPAANDRDVPVEVTMRFFLLRPKKPKYSDVPLGKPDVDKLIRGVLDGLTGCAYVDDAQVAAVAASKQWTEYEKDAGAIIVVRALD